MCPVIENSQSFCIVVLARWHSNVTQEFYSHTLSCLSGSSFLSAIGKFCVLVQNSYRGRQIKCKTGQMLQKYVKMRKIAENTQKKLDTDV